MCDLDGAEGFRECGRVDKRPWKTMKLGEHVGKAKPSTKPTKPHCLPIFNLNCQGLFLPMTSVALLMGHVTRHNDFLDGALNVMHLQIILLSGCNNQDQF